MTSDDVHAKALAVYSAKRFIDQLVDEGIVDPIDIESIEREYNRVQTEWQEEFDDPDYLVEMSGPKLGLRVLSDDDQYVSYDTEGPSPWDSGYRRRIPELVRLTDGLLDDVSFTVEPTEYPRDEEGPRLVASTDNWEHSAQMRDFGDYCDVSRFVDFMNRVVARFETEKQFIRPIITEDQRVWVFFAHPDRTKEFEEAFDTAFEQFN